MLAAFGTLTAYGQTVTFTAEELIVPPNDITTTKCVQVGIFMTYTGAQQNWGHFEASLDYTAPVGFLDGNPFVNVTDFANPPKAGLTNPGTVMSNSSGNTTPCAAGDIINSATQGGSAITLMQGAGGTPAVVTESVVAGAVDITSLSLGNLFSPADGETYLMAILEFPLAASQGNGQIDITFRAGAANNFITDGVTTLDAMLDDGFIQVFQTQDCDATNNATFADNVGSNSTSTTAGNTLSVDYLDAAWGGPGAEVDVTINFGAAVEAYQLVDDQGFDTGVVMVAGPGSDTQTVNPAAVATTNYTLTYFTLGLDGITLTPGTPCTMAVSYNAPAVVADWNVGAAPGLQGTLTVSLTNASPVGGVFGTIDVPNGATGLADPTNITNALTPTGTSGGTVTLEPIDQIIPDGTWAGPYVVATQNVSGATANDTATLGFTCPSNNTSAVVGTVTIGDTIDLTLAADDVISYDVTYNGVTTNLPGDTTTFTTPNNAMASATSITVAANGVGPDGMPCDDTVVITLDWDAPVCDSTTQNPDSTVTPVDVGTVITLTLITSGATTATINGTPMSVTAGTPGTDETVTWEATHTAVADTTVTATITGPDGDSTTCTWTIDINCIDPVIVSVATVGSTGITIFGTPDCVYTVSVTDSNGNVTLFDITAGPDGFGTNNSFVIPPDATIAVGQQTLPNITDSVRTVPTLGEWGLMAFVALLMVAGVSFMRKRRLA